MRKKREMPKDPLITALIDVVGEAAVLHQKADLTVYECDGYTLESGMPRAVVFPKTTVHVAFLVRLLEGEQIPYIARGAGTGLSGGATPLGGEVIISLVKMNQLLEADFENRQAVVQPGFINLKLSDAIAEDGYYYAPDPSSQSNCTIGGNVAENAGGAHCLKYGVTTNHILGLEVVQTDGEVVEIGQAGVPDMPGYDLLGMLTGSEGTMGIVTKITVRVSKSPQGKKTALAYFDSVDDAGGAVSDIISAGIVPAALEMMDDTAIEAVEASAYPVGHPKDLAAFLLIEVDGLSIEIDEQMQEIVGVCENRNVRDIKVAQDEAERGRWWANRKMGFGAMGMISPDYLVQDGVIPRSRLSEVLQRISEISKESGLRIANIFHAGDGNLHPLILFDARKPGETELASKVGSACLKACTDVGGAITGEHGVGIEKKEEMRLMFTDDELQSQLDLRSVWNPDDLLNPGKLLPTPGRCVEVKQAEGSAAAQD